MGLSQLILGRIHRFYRPKSGMRLRTMLAWGVHLYTGLGLVIAALVAILVVRGGHESFRLAFLLLALATLIDATDGWLARKMDVNQQLARFDGRRLDDIIDFHTFTSLPLLLIWRSGVLPPEYAGWLLLPLLASAYGFCQVEAKTADGYFLGFPSYWNIVAFYLYFLRPPLWLALAVIVGFAVLTFIPAKYLYSTQPGRLNQVTNALGIAWAAVLLLVLVGVLNNPGKWVVASLCFPIYYLLASWTITLRDWQRRRSARR